jgi:hypothetical protein
MPYDLGKVCDSVSVYYANCRSLNSKLSALQHLIASNSFDIFCLTETWLDFEIGVIDNNYCTYMCNRVNKIGGGVMIICKSLLNPKFVSVFRTNCIEVVVITIGSDKDNIKLAVVYRPPNCDVIESDLLNQFLTDCFVNCDNFVVLGDFNHPNINWNNGICASIISQKLYDTVTNLGACQMVNVPTRGDSILDLVFGSTPYIVSNIDVKDPFVGSDHCCVQACINLLSPRNYHREDKVKLLFDKVDFELLHSYLITISWDDNVTNG